MNENLWRVNFWSCSEIYFGHWKQSWFNICEEAETKTGFIRSIPMYLIFIKHILQKNTVIKVLHGTWTIKNKSNKKHNKKDIKARQTQETVKGYKH